MSSLLADIALQVDLVDIALMTLLVVVAIAIIRLRNLFEVVVLSGIFSLLSACIFTTLDAVDVAFTEAAVGAGISTVLFLTTLSLTSRRAASQYRHSRAGIVVCLVTGGALVYGTVDMPHFGDPEAPVHQHVAPRYIGESPREIGVPNMVTSVLASYRGYDTLGETAVIFTAGLTVLLLLRRSGPGDAHKAVDERRDSAAMRDAMVLRVMSKLFIPLILLFALYVQFHGDFGPGGGFQAGVIFAAAFVLYSMINGIEHTRKIAPPDRVEIFISLGLLLYIGTGLASFFTGGNFLEYKVLAADAVAGEHLGIILIELGVGITVAAVMINTYVHFSSRRRV